MIEVLRPGSLATIQDYGRPGWAHLGVPRSGAADLRSLTAANRLVGNDDHAAAIEITMGRAAFRFAEPTAFALAGADSAAACDGRPVEHGRWCHAIPGARLELGEPRYGMRTYLAVAGGVAVDPVLGSRSTDTLSSLGPAPLRAGDLLPTGTAAQRPAGFPDFTITSNHSDSVVLRYTLGPHDDHFGPAGVELLESAAWSVTAEANRVGVRLAGAKITSTREGSLPSEGMTLGAIQLPADGAPIVFLADHPATGGYPVLGVVDADAVCELAQSRPGRTVRFARG